ncbi:ABC transporter ATP-binding protein [Shimia sp. R9_2]|uniref:ABC transporter transmembrane domain-containing protein n=1 Tax=Shimia sp. R9_2 TaxID=2821112 RepID=UPI001ADBAFD9|nr:ABC transporter transmembrane domain-containing protein [Shimia sp. R9_2]MBO9398126.1 ABC transporter ATP-binding protein [Shimia sp. R9_2]
MEQDRFKERDSSFFLNMPIWMASLSLNIVALAMPIVILLIFDRVIPFQSLDTLRMLTLILVVSVGIEFALRWCRLSLLNITSERAAVSNYRRFAHRVLHAETDRFALDEPSTYLDRFGAIAQLRDYSSGQNHAVLIDLPFTLLFAVMIGLIGGWLVAVPLLGFGIVLMFSLIMKRAQWSLFDTRKTLDNRRYAFLSEVLSGSQTVKANRMERQMARRFEKLENQTVDLSHRLIQFSGLAQNFGAAFGQISIAAMGLFGAYLVIQQQIGMAEMAACMLLNGRIVQPLTKLMTLWVQSESVAASWRKLHEIDALEVPDPPVARSSAIEGRITIDNLRLQHKSGATDPAVLKRLAISPGQTILMTGAARWQLQAFYDAILGRNVPSGSRVLIDHLPSQSRARERGHNAIVVLENDPAILSGTLLENLSAFGDETQIARAKEIAAKLGLERRINRLPTGYNTQMGDGGGVFETDPANRQLIALVRVLALQPRILVMSEPTAALDTPEREALSAHLAEMKSKTTILMDSPDPHMKRLADIECDLESGSAVPIDWQVDAPAEATIHSHRRDVA